MPRGYPWKTEEERSEAKRKRRAYMKEYLKGYMPKWCARNPEYMKSYRAEYKLL